MTTTMTVTSPRFPQARRAALLAGLIALAVMAIGMIFNPGHFLRAYLFGWVFWVGVSLGAMAIVMLHHLTGGGWGYPVRRLGEAAAMVLPAMAVLFVPIAIGLGRLYPWADSATYLNDPLLAHRRLLFNPAAVIVRSFAYLAIWSLFAWGLWRNSLAHDRAAGVAEAGTRTLRMRTLSRAGLILYFVTMSLASIDWVGSREAHWYSSVFGFVMIIGQAASGLCLLLVTVWLLSRRRHPGGNTDTADVAAPLADPKPRHLQDLGNLLLTVVILWAYMGFSQFLVIWLGNTQEDITWYVHRSRGGWQYVAVALIGLHFFVPMLLFVQDAKRRVAVLGGIAAGVFLMHVLHVLWLVAPSAPGDDPGGMNWMDVLAPIAIGGLWSAAFLWLLRDVPRVPLGLRVVIAEPDARDERTGSQTSGASRPVA